MHIQTTAPQSNFTEGYTFIRSKNKQTFSEPAPVPGYIHVRSFNFNRVCTRPSKFRSLQDPYHFPKFNTSKICLKE